MSEQISKGTCTRVGKPCLKVWGTIYVVTVFLCQWRKFYLICCNFEDHITANMIYSYKEKKLKSGIFFKIFLASYKSWRIFHACHFVWLMLVTHIHINTIYKLHTHTHFLVPQMRKICNWRLICQSCRYRIDEGDRSSYLRKAATSSVYGLWPYTHFSDFTSWDRDQQSIVHAQFSLETVFCIDHQLRMGLTF